MPKWQVESFSESTVGGVNADIQTYLRGVSVNGSVVANSVKVTTSDQNDGDARGVVVTNTQMTSVPAMPDFQGWNVFEFDPITTDYDELYGNLSTALNNNVLPDGTQISDNQIYFSQISMTNRQNGHATITIFYPSL
jgi:hypothetical protein